jgi:hypothetical protein
MEREEERVEVDEIDVGFFLLHIFFKVSPCGYAKVIGTYKVEKKRLFWGLNYLLHIQICSCIMNKIWQILLFSLITITMSIKDGMKIGRIYL